jgi:NADPH2:quinone reductase
VHCWKSRPKFINCLVGLRSCARSRRTFASSAQSNMKEAIVAKGPKVTIHDVPIPKPNADQVLIKVLVSGSNPKDWKRPEYGDAHNSGDDIAGIVEAVGDNVTEFKKGDRVAAFHEMMAPHGSFAEYAIAWAYTTFHLPKNTSFEEVCKP